MGNLKNSDYMHTWSKLCTPPPEALKKITGGRLKGMTDINPQWRIKRMTEVFGQCGVGWKYEIIKEWTKEVSDKQVMVFVKIFLYIRLKDTTEWGDPIPAIGGSTLIANESRGLYSSTEAYKMALTDALSVAMKIIGVASDIYEGKENNAQSGSKYADIPQSISKPKCTYLKEISPALEQSIQTAAQNGLKFDKFLISLNESLQKKNMLLSAEKESEIETLFRTAKFN